MKITIIAIGKIKEQYLKNGLDEYLKRLSPFVKINVSEIADEKAPENLSENEMLIVKQKEGSRILQQIKDNQYVIALAIEGESLSSEELANQIDTLSTHGKNNIVFIIGGSLGLSEDVYKRADKLLSFSKMTFPHQLMRLILIEQIYRAFKINRGEPYHK